MIARVTPAVVQRRALMLGGVGLTLLVLAFVLRPFPQPEDYHHFADQRAWLGIPNFGDVISNLAFALAGWLGLRVMPRPAVRAMGGAPRRAYGLMFFGLLFTAFGSAYYHWMPSDARLVWDRLPMTIVFMPLLAATYAERLRWRSDIPLLGLTALGVASVVYWKLSNNLMPYLIAEGGSVLLILLALLLLPTPWSGRRWLWLALASYAVAVVCERFDRQVFGWTAGIISGHTIKHLSAAVAFLFIAHMLRRQRLKTSI